jgi:Family of unknown function (DUF5681)
MSDHESSKGPVGYGSPPRRSRFQKGQSGNPKGRVKESNNLATVLMNSAREVVTVNEGGRRRSISKLEAMSKQLVNKAASGDPRATQLLMQMLQMFEGRFERTTPEAVIDEADERVVQQLFVRIRQMTGGTSDGDCDAG